MEHTNELSIGERIRRDIQSLHLCELVQPRETAAIVSIQGQHYTHKALKKYMEGTTKRLLLEGGCLICPGKKVFLMVHNGPEAAVLLLWLMNCCCAVPVDANIAPGELSRLLEELIKQSPQIRNSP